MNINDSFSYVSNKIRKISFLQWAGLRHSIPDFLKDDRDYIYTLTPSSLQINNNIFDVKKKKSKDYYSLLVMKKSQPPNIVHKWKSDFNISDDLLRESFILPHSVALESYVKAFQYKILNNILYTNTKLCKIGFRADDLCTFCEAEREMLTESKNKVICFIKIHSFLSFLVDQQELNFFFFSSLQNFFKNDTDW